MRKIHFILSCLSFLILLHFASCISLKIVDNNVIAPNSLDWGAKAEGSSFSLFGFEFGKPHIVDCPAGIAIMELHRGGTGFLLDFLQGYLFMPGPVTTRDSSVVCASVPPPPAKVEVDSEFSDVLTLKNGEIILNVKITPTQKTLLVEFPDGTTKEFQKKEVLSMKKGK